MKHTTSRDLREGDIVRLRDEIGEEWTCEILAQSPVGEGFWKALIVGAGTRTLVTPRDTLLALDRKGES